MSSNQWLLEGCTVAYQGGGRSIAISHDGEWVIASSQDYSSCRVWHCVDGEMIEYGNLSLPNGEWILALSAVANEAAFVLGDGVGNVHLLDPATMCITHVAHAFDESVRQIVDAGNHQDLFCLSHYGQICRINIRQNNIAWKSEHFMELEEDDEQDLIAMSSIAVSCGALYGANDGYDISVLDIDSGCIIKSYDTAYRTDSAIALGDSRFSYLRREHGEPSATPGELWILDIAQGKSIQLSSEARSLNMYGEATCLVGLESGKLGLLHDFSLQSLNDTQLHNGPVTSISVSKDGRIATCSCDDDSIGVWRID